VIDCQKHLFSNPKNAKLMTSHADQSNKDDSKLRHLPDARQRKTLMQIMKSFATKPET